MLEWLEPPFAPGHWVPEQVEIAGGECLMGEAGEKSVTTTFEKIVESAPDILVLIPCGYYAEDILRQLPNTVFPESFREIPAIANGEVWALDATSYFSRPAPRVVDGAEILAKIVHPEIFGEPSEQEAIRVSRDLLRFAKAA
jgi:iron complex transport system substrate-binding protein